ncbi:hypothetical protein Tco_1199232 [Tanacetum coccineum]
MMTIKTNKPLLDQTRGPRENELEKNQSQPVHQRKRHPRHMASHMKGLNLNTRLLANLFKQGSYAQLPKDLEEPHNRSLKHGVTEDQQNEDTPTVPDWFCRHQQKLPLPIKEDPRESFNELMDTPLDFSAFVMNRLKVDTLTLELLAGLTFKLMKGSCKSLVELEYFFEEVYKATIDQLDWNNPEECGVKCWLAMTNMYSGESHIGGDNDNNSMDLLLTRNLLEMPTPNAKSLLS